MDHGTHYIVTLEGEAGVSVESPQVPGFVVGRPWERTFAESFTQFVGDRTAEAPPIHVHRQWRFETPEKIEYLLRVAGEREGLRLLLSHRFMRLMGTDHRFSLIDRAAPTVTGEILFICALPGDTMEFIERQLSLLAGDVAVLLVAAPGQQIWVVELSIGTDVSSREWYSLWEFGLTTRSTVDDLMNATGVEVGHHEVTYSNQRLRLG